MEEEKIATIVMNIENSHSHAHSLNTSGIDVDNFEAKKRKQVSHNHAPARVNNDSKFDYDPSPPPQPTPIVEEATLAASSSKRCSGASKRWRTTSHKKIEEVYPTQNNKLKN
jgi:hypothetical protein